MIRVIDPPPMRTAKTLVAALAALSLCGCSIIVGGDPPAGFACTPGLEFDACTELTPRQRCVADEGATVGVCQPCGAVEVCGNGIDDDCDGTIDIVFETCNEADDDCDGRVDEALDDDGDGVSWCPTAEGPVDCDDNNPLVFPRSAGVNTEPCDGLDNDCNTATADGSSQCDLTIEVCNPMSQACEPVFCDTRGDLCSADEFCDQTVSPASCAPLDDSCFRTGCDGGTRCDPRTGECVAPQPDGTLCDGDAECTGSLCIDGAAIRGAAHLEGRAGICARTCCNNDDCDSESVCWASGSGARACVPTARLALGEFGVPAIEACASRAECDQDCSLDIDNAFTVSSRLTLACGAPFQGRDTCNDRFECFGFECLDGTCESVCFGATDCPTGLCVRNRCVETCGTDGDCPTGSGDRWSGAACRVGSFRLGEEARDDFVTFCSYENSGGAGGAACTEDGECQDAACLTAEGETMGDARTCAATCCNDDDCGGDQCRPVFLRGHWETHCRPRPTFPSGAG